MTNPVQNEGSVPSPDTPNVEDPTVNPKGKANNEASGSTESQSSKGSMSEMEKKYPAFYKEWVKSVGMNLMNKMRKHQDKINKILKENR